MTKKILSKGEKMRKFLISVLLMFVAEAALAESWEWKAPRGPKEMQPFKCYRRSESIGAALAFYQNKGCRWRFDGAYTITCPVLEKRLQGVLIDPYLWIDMVYITDSKESCEMRTKAVQNELVGKGTVLK